jgi:hypothetical protein
MLESPDLSTAGFKIRLSCKAERKAVRSTRPIEAMPALAFDSRVLVLHAVTSATEARGLW